MESKGCLDLDLLPAPALEAVVKALPGKKPAVGISSAWRDAALAVSRSAALSFRVNEPDAAAHLPLLKRAFSNASRGPSELRLILQGDSWGGNEIRIPVSPFKQLLGPFSVQDSPLLHVHSLQLQVRSRTLDPCSANRWHTSGSKPAAKKWHLLSLGCDGHPRNATMQ
jgi:hypothetical protein